MKATLVLCLLVVAVVGAVLEDYDWIAFKIKYGKRYSLAEEEIRKDIFRKNVEYYKKHNNEASQGWHMFTLGIHEFSDKTEAEIHSTLKGFKVAHDFVRTGEFFEAEPQDIPDALDWRDAGLVTPVKNQSPCGSCWAFSATGALEAANAKKTGKLISLSEQNLLDCVTPNLGCAGGYTEKAFDYAKHNNGIDKESSYPYLAQVSNCSFNPDPKNVGGRCSGRVKIPEGNETALLHAVATHGPVSVSIDAGHGSFTAYKSGVYHEPKCRSNFHDHAVLVVGYGTEDGTDYWLIKNSWGTSWGNHGFAKMLRNRDNHCGIATHAIYPTV